MRGEILNACYSEAQAEALVAHVDCVVGMRCASGSDAVRNFAIGFYGGLGERESVAVGQHTIGEAKAFLAARGLEIRR